MSLNHLLSILCFIIIFAFSFGYDVSAQKCGETKFFRPNDAYDTNRRLVLSTLASNVSSRDGFYNVSTGEGPGKIYALGLCIPRTDPKFCSDCIQRASIILLQSCPNQTDSWYWKADETVKTPCFVRYSNHMFFEEFTLDPFLAEFRTEKVTGDVAGYNRTWEDTMKSMISAASSSTPGTLAGRHYAAHITSLPDFRSIYVLMQCIPGIASLDCKDCLEANVRAYQTCCGGYIGGTIRRPICYFRFDPYPFLGAFDKLSP